jgi:hypothetical protein
MPVWGLDKLICAAPFLSFVDPELEELLSIPDLLKEEIMTRFRLFGGVPRHIFGTSHSRAQMSNPNVGNQLSEGGSSRTIFQRRVRNDQ